MRAAVATILIAGVAMATNGMSATLEQKVNAKIDALEPRVIEWRRDIHQHPELSNRETRTAALVADHLEKLGMEVTRGVAHTGVVGVLKGGRPGPVVALRADMDALPVTEQTDVPFASKVRTEFDGQEVGVMHACGHDTHVAILMGVAEALAAVRDEIPGTVKFIFQPAEEGAPQGEEGGAELMVREGVLRNPEPDAIFGLHVTARFPVGSVALRSGGALASVDTLRIVVEGKQTHGAYPWLGVDPIVVASQIILGLQTIPSRQLDSTVAPSIVTIGRIEGGVRNNIIPDRVEMWGTLRALDAGMRGEIHKRVRRTATSIAEAAGAKATVTIDEGYPITHNDPGLTARMRPTLERVVGQENVIDAAASLGAEDFSFYQEKVPGLFYWLGGRPEGVSADDAPANHSPFFFVDERSLRIGVRTLAAAALDFLEGGR